jgi:hypothetical protein
VKEYSLKKPSAIKIKYLILINNHSFSKILEKSNNRPEKTTSPNLWEGGEKKRKEKEYERRRITSSSYYLLHKPQRPSGVS